MLGVAVVLLAVAASATSAVAASPYPWSNRITGIQWHPDTYQYTAEGGDIWPITWAADGSLLAAWGDGVVTCAEKASYGVAAIATAEPSVALTPVHCGPGPHGLGKMMALIATDDTLFTRFNPQDDSTRYPLLKSVDGGATWTQPGAPFPFLLDSFVQFGRGNAGAPGGYIYALEPWTTEIRLVRVAKEQAHNGDAYEYFSGTPFAPAWKLGRSGSKAIFVDPAGTRRPTITYNPGLDRYLLTVAHSLVEVPSGNKVGIFEAPNPWGPWRTVSYVDDFLGMSGGNFFGLHFPIKWQADEGTTLWATFSCYTHSSSAPCGPYHDRFNLMKASLTVEPEPEAPVAVDDSTTTFANTAVTIAALANDSGSGLTVRTLTTPANGTARINSDGSIGYTPKAGYTGGDGFSYLAADGFEQPTTANVTVTVENRPPVAAADSATAIAPASVRVYVLANDSDPDAHSLTIASATTPGRGTITISTDRKSILYKPASGFSGSDSFTYTSTDKHDGTAQGTVTIAVTNRPPVANTDSVAVVAGKTTRLAVLGNDSDPDGHSVTVATVGSAGRGTLAVTTDRKGINYTAAKGHTGSDSFTYTARDGYGGVSGAATVTVAVQNRPPVAKSDSLAAAYNISTRLAVPANDTDPDGHVLYVQSVTAPTRGTATISADGKAVIYRPTNGYRGGDSFSYTIHDGYGGTSKASVTLTVGGGTS